MNKNYIYILIFISIITLMKCAAVTELNRKQIVKGPVFEPYHGLKKNIAVLDFENNTGHGTEKFGSAVSDKLVSLLVKSGRFTIIERQKIQDILQEQALGQSGAITENTAHEVGKLLGVQALILGDVLEAKQETGSHDFNKNADEDKGGWGFALKATVGHVKLHYRMVDTSTGEIMISNESSGTEIKPGFGFSNEEFDFEDMFAVDQSVVGYALRKAVNKMAIDIVNNAPTIEWVGKVVKVKADSLLYFTPGTRSGIKIGDQFTVMGEIQIADKMEMTERIQKGLVEVVGFIGDRVSKATIVGGSNFIPGDKLKKVEKRAIENDSNIN